MDEILNSFLTFSILFGVGTLMFLKSGWVGKWIRFPSMKEKQMKPLNISVKWFGFFVMVFSLYSLIYSLWKVK